MALLSGKTGFVELTATNYNFEEWEINIDGELPDVSHFRAGGGLKRVDGVDDNELTFFGPYDRGAMALDRGTEYTFKLGLDAGVFLTTVCRIKNIKVNNKYKDAPRVEVTALASDGSSFIGSIA